MRVVVAVVREVELPCWLEIDIDIACCVSVEILRSDSARGVVSPYSDSCGRRRVGVLSVLRRTTTKQ